MLSITINQTVYQINPQSIDISIPMDFHGSQPNAYGVPMASARAFEGGGFVGDVRRGGSCNFEEFKFIAHCNGTHTECVGHISKDRIFIHEILKDSFVPATLVSINLERGLASGESYQPDFDPADMIISRKKLEEKLQNHNPDFLDALIIRTLPNASSKTSRDYMKIASAFFSFEAMEYIVELGVKHLLVDTPSVDRTFDEGRLSAHHIFWEVPQGSNEINPDNCSDKTITEMIYVPGSVEDGNYLVNLQIAPFLSDAAPSRVRIFGLAVGL